MRLTKGRRTVRKSMIEPCAPRQRLDPPFEELTPSGRPNPMPNGSLTKLSGSNEPELLAEIEYRVKSTVRRPFFKGIRDDC
jgi:hypothetical protein